jgi:hypothetical protein
LFFQMWWLGLVSVRRVTRRRDGSVCMVGDGVSSDDPVVFTGSSVPDAVPGGSHPTREAPCNMRQGLLRESFHPAAAHRGIPALAAVMREESFVHARRFTDRFQGFCQIAAVACVIVA